jgi:peptide-methionine (S)-S-oxide reductase
VETGGNKSPSIRGRFTSPRVVLPGSTRQYPLRRNPDIMKATSRSVMMTVRRLVPWVSALVLAAGLVGTAAARQAAAPGQSIATFAGGCFWCVEEAFDKLPGVLSTTSGYTGGNRRNPTYEEVSSGQTGHAEAVQVVYDPSKITYEQLLQAFWRNIDPTVKDRQFCDTGSQYRSAIFYHGDEQKRLAEESKRALDRTKPFKNPIVTEIVAAGPFYPAEDYHQDYYKTNALRYKFYKFNCGREQRLEQIWGKTKTQ